MYYAIVADLCINTQFIQNEISHAMVAGLCIDKHIENEISHAVVALLCIDKHIENEISHAVVAGFCVKCIQNGI